MAEADDLGVMDRIDGVLAMLGDVAGLDVVDVGCGEGAVAEALAARGAVVAGYDPFIAGTGVVTVGPGRYQLSHATAQAIPQPDGSADVVLFMFSLHHVPAAAMPAALSEARRVLKPGGRLCVAEPVAQGPAQYVMAPYHDETQVRADAIAALGRHAAPAFASERVATFAEERPFDGFDAYARQAIGNMRYTGYAEADVLSPEVRRRFDEMAARHGGVFAQPVRVNLYQ